MIFVLVILIVFLGIFAAVKKVKNKNQKQKLPPGPWGLPLLGHLVSLGRNPHLTLMKWQKTYGPIISCRFGSFPAVALGDSKMIKEAFSTAEFSGRPQIPVYVENGQTKGLSLSEGPYNAELRQFLIRKLKQFGMGRKTFENKIHEGVSELTDFIKMREELPVTSKDIPSTHVIRTLWSIMMTDELNQADAEHLNQAVEKLSHLGSVLSELAGFMPWFESLARIISFGRLSLMSTRLDQLKKFHSLTAKLLQKKENNRTKYQVKSQTPIDVMDFYLEKVEKTTDEFSAFHASMDSAKVFLADLFGAGIDAPHLTVLWMFNYMARNPESQLKLQEEIDQVIGNARLASISDQGQMPYADAVIHEVLRLCPPGPFALPHKATVDICFHGYTIKKDTMIFANIYGVHHDPEIWGDAENFRPERWFGESGKKLKRDHFVAFSTGRRVCPGEALAREQLFLYITTLLQKYSVKFYGEVPEVKAVFGIFLDSTQFTVVFNRRQIK